MSIYGIMLEAKGTGEKETIPGLVFNKNFWQKGISFLFAGKKRHVKLRIKGSKDKDISKNQIKAYHFLITNQETISKKVVKLIISFSKSNTDEMKELKSEKEVSTDCVLKNIVIDQSGSCSLLFDSKSETKKGGDQGIGVRVYPSYSIDIQAGVL